MVARSSIAVPIDTLAFKLSDLRKGRMSTVPPPFLGSFLQNTVTRGVAASAKMLDRSTERGDIDRIVSNINRLYVPV